MGYKNKTELREALYQSNRLLVTTTNNIANCTEISDSNKETIRRFKNWMLGVRGLTIERTVKQMKTCKAIALLYKKDFVDYTIEDTSAAMTEIRMCGKYSESSIYDCLKCFRSLFKFMDNIPDGQQSPRVDGIKTKRPINKYKPSDLLSPTEMLILLQKINDLMYRTLTGVAYECSFRPHELRILCLKDIKKNSTGIGYYITIPEETKTGERTVLVTVCAGLLEQYLANHLFTHDPEAPLFYSVKDGKPEFIRHAAFAKMLKSAGKKHLKKIVTPYILRHSRLSFLVLSGMPTELIKMLCGHSKRSNTLATTYTHLSQNNRDNYLQRMAGIEIELDEKELNTFTVRRCSNEQCVNCQQEKMLLPFESICPVCKMPIDPENYAIKKSLDINNLNAEERSFIRDIMQEEFERLAEQKGIV